MLYSEMQNRTNDAFRKTYLELLKNVYPKSGYSFDAGGVLHNIRTSTSNAKCIEYHKQFYRAENLTLIISGQVVPEKVFSALKPVQETAFDKPKIGDFEKPWQTVIESINQSQDIKVSFIVSIQ